MSLNFTLHLPLLVAAGVLLLFPLPLLFGLGGQFRELDRTWSKLRWKAVFFPWHWLDLARSVAGVKLLLAAFAIVPISSEPIPKTAAFVFAGMLAVGLIVQTVACRAEAGFHLPFAYLFATVVVVFPPVLAVLVLITAIMVSFAVNTLTAFLWALPVALGAIGLWLFPKWMLLAPVAALPFVAAVIPMMFQGHFVLAHRAVPADPESLRDLR
jgi:hypothetical protein